ncbi:MAG: squalene synthase HpnC [Deltaproteobacteria bacterium CG11_big_fil_rev_8_21_14_0_20_47_16]|nr:MAG: squalene synthase HpnC [Deltaproteobacteria bacterium CG11_big_fil_rev_8_21_14_0_20_47_16]
MHSTMTMETAQTECRRICYGHYENFPVASVLVPKHLRQHVCNIYAFARTSDDFADEAKYAGQRAERLAEWRHWTEECYRGVYHNAIFMALSETIREFSLSPSLFLDLITAFQMDVDKSRYANFDEVLFYCRHSANPVGRLILALYGYHNTQWEFWSDEICTALQLANFWQDVAVDLKKDRIYLPQEEMARYGVTEQDLFAGKMSEAVRQLMIYQVDRTQAMFDRGLPLCTAVTNKRLSMELRCTWLGGSTILRRIRDNDFNVFDRPTITWRDKGMILWKALMQFPRVQQ